ncbi:MAG: hypothetical protein ACR2MG_16595 [Pyrinomonadaceae bacterium]
MSYRECGHPARNERDSVQNYTSLRNFEFDQNFSCFRTIAGRMPALPAPL